MNDFKEKNQFKYQILFTFNHVKHSDPVHSANSF